MTLDWFAAYSKSVVATDESVLSCIRAWHTGYRGVKHERMVTIFTDERWVIQDTLTSKKQHTYRLHWLLPDWEWDVENREQGIEISLKSPQGKIILVLQTDPQLSNLHSLLSIVRAGEVVFGQCAAQPFEGWVSPTYGEKTPALSLALEVQNLSDVRFSSEFIFPK
jgi:hypothetical protein